MLLPMLSIASLVVVSLSPAAAGVSIKMTGEDLPSPVVLLLLAAVLATMLQTPGSCPLSQSDLAFAHALSSCLKLW